MRTSLILVVFALLLAACGSDDAGSAASSSTAGSSTDLQAGAPVSCEDEGNLVIVEEQLGGGAEATRDDVVTVNYEGRLPDGDIFDRGESVVFSLSSVVPGFREGIAGMKVGGRRELTIPPSMGYGDEGAGGVIPPCATLLFDVELLGIAE